MIIYTQDREYFKSFSLGKGIRVALHPFRTWPDLDSAGMSISPGFETFVGFQMVC